MPVPGEPEPATAKIPPEPFDDQTPSPPGDGWYAALNCWDGEEGFYPATLQAAGGKWVITDDPISHYWPTPFPDQDQALDYAYEQDPDW